MKPTVKLIGTDGNAFSIIGKVIKALKKEGIDPMPFQEEALASESYDALLQLVMRTVEVE